MLLISMFLVVQSKLVQIILGGPVVDGFQKILSSHAEQILFNAGFPSES